MNRIERIKDIERQRVEVQKQLREPHNDKGTKLYDHKIEFNEIIKAEPYQALVLKMAKLESEYLGLISELSTAELMLLANEFPNN